MKFEIAEFEIEEIEGIDGKERERQSSIVNEFTDERVRENIRGILSDGDKHFFKYVIHEVLVKNPIYVGEITFSGNKEDEFDIGIEIEEKFRRQGYGYRLLTMSIDRLCKSKRVKKLTYRVMSNNIASKSLAEKMGGKLIKEVEPPKSLGFTFLIYEIEPFVIDYTFLTKYIPLLNSFKNSDRSSGSLDDKFTEEVQLFVDANEQLGLKDYFSILQNSGVKNLFGDIHTMNEQCLYAVLVYCVRQERFSEGELKRNLENGKILSVLERIEQIHKN